MNLSKPPNRANRRVNQRQNHAYIIRQAAFGMFDMIMSLVYQSSLD